LDLDSTRWHLDGLETFTWGMFHGSYFVLVVMTKEQTISDLQFQIIHTFFFFGFSSSYTPVLLPSLYCFLSSYSKVVFLLAL
jgi:hypothetical protein